MTRRNWIIVGIVLLLLACGLWVVSTVRSGTSAALRAMQTPTASAPIQPAVTAKASLVPAQYARLSFPVGGTVAQVLVKEGDKVKKGDPIAQLETGDLELEVRAAQDSLDVATATLSQDQSVGTADEIAAAEADLRNAQAQYDRAKNGPGVDDLMVLQANLGKAEAALKNAQAAYDGIGGASNPYIGMAPQSLTLQQATQDYQIAKANYNLKTKVDAASLAAAESALYNARTALDLKKNGAPEADLSADEARVQQARTALEQAQTALAKARLTALMDGTVTNVDLRPGEMVSAGAPVLTIADLSSLLVETTDLDEWGAAHVTVGQKVQVMVNAFSDKTLTGKVSNIALQSVTLSTGDISYVVTASLDQQDPDLRWGMTAKVTFVQ